MCIFCKGKKFYDLDHGFISSNNSFDELNGFIFFIEHNRIFLGISLTYSVSQMICKSFGFDQGTITLKRLIIYDFGIEICSGNSNALLDCQTSSSE